MPELVRATPVQSSSVEQAAHEAVVDNTPHAGPGVQVLVLDVDAHCGGGTYSLIKDTPGIIHVDVAVSPYDRYEPTGRSTLDIVRTASDYLPTFVKRLHALSDVAISVVIYNAGVDLHEACDVGGMPGVTDQLLATREALFFGWADRRRVPVAFVLAGGYIGARLSRAALVQLHRETITQALGPGVHMFREIIKANPGHDWVL